MPAEDLIGNSEAIEDADRLAMRVVTETSCPRAVSSSMIGRKTRGWAAAVQSTQTRIGDVVGSGSAASAT